jgi:hypothetical protein
VFSVPHETTASPVGSRLFIFNVAYLYADDMHYYALQVVACRMPTGKIASKQADAKCRDRCR